MNKYLTLLAFFTFIGFNAHANHIVGGEIELVHVNGFVYNLNLIVYFDKAQTANPNPDASATVFIYKNGSDSVVDTFFLPLVNDSVVNYTNNECAIAALVTSRPFYTAEVLLDSVKYSDPAGYYIVWERCCRNSAMTNVINDGFSVGMTYVLEFPALMKDGERFINSSPQLFPPLSDYACINQLFYTSFAGSDPDDDSLVYTLVTPLNSSSVAAVPTPSPKPHFPVEYAPGFNEFNIIPGSPALAISKTGFLTVTPFFTGVYVFSVLVEEFRDGEKIGQVTRDFQMLVIDGCDPPAPPNAEVRLPGETNFYNEVDTIRFTVADEKCFEFLVIDDAGEQVKLRAEGVNFEEGIDDIFEFTQGFINENKDTLRIEICIPDCPYVRGTPYIIDLIAADNACPLPQLDTVRLIIEVEPPPNDYPLFTEANKHKTVEVPERDVFKQTLIAMDVDGDNLVARLEAVDFIPADMGISINTTKSIAGSIDIEFVWDTDCQKYDFIETNHFEVYVVVDDLDFCSEEEGDTIFYDLTVVLPPNTEPKVTSSASTTITRFVDSGMLTFDIDVNDDDGDEISLNMIGEGFDPSEIGMLFENKVGNGQIDSKFEWDLDCATLGFKDNQSFTLYFFSEDEDLCRQINSDTLEVNIDILIPFNNKPEFDSYSDYELIVNEEFSLDIIANDFNNAQVLNIDFLAGKAKPPYTSFSMERGTGEGSVSTTINWTPDCNVLWDNLEPKRFTIFLLAWDDGCPEVKYDTLAINLLVKELDANYNAFYPPNVFTPNGDGTNDVYTLTGLLDKNANLPPDNCEDEFQSIVIFDRTGKQVFKSTDRNFAWSGNNNPSGVYYYSIEYLNSNYKGTITMLY